MRTSVLAMVLGAALGGVACGNKHEAAPEASAGPVYTPLLANSVRGLAPECEIRKGATTGDVAQVIACAGNKGTVEVSLTPTNRLRRVDVKLVAMPRVSATAQVSYGLGPLAGKVLQDKLVEMVSRLRSGERDSAQDGGAKLDVVAGGPIKSMPDYAITLRW